MLVQYFYILCLSKDKTPVSNYAFFDSKSSVDEINDALSKLLKGTGDILVRYEIISTTVIDFSR